MAGVDASALYRLTADIGAVTKGAQAKTQQAVAKTLIDIEGDAKVGAPVDTGDLRNSISHEIDGDGMGGEVGPTVDYGIWQEIGTSTQPGQPYLGPAFDRRSPVLEQALAQIADGLAG
jgi:HK97 gp10 family phage protein